MISKKNTLKNFIYIIYFTLITFFLYKVPLIGDDVINKQLFPRGVNIKKIFSLVFEQYFNWSSRTLINFVMFFFESTPKILFCVTTGIIFCLMIYIVDKLINSNSIVNYFVTILSFSIFPIIYFSTAGWIATTTTYLYPFIAMVIAIRLLQLKNRFKIYNLIVALLLLIYSFNNEQLLVIAVVSLVILLIYNKKLLIFKNKLYVVIIAIIVNLVWFILSPGNKVRNLKELQNFPTFKKLSFINKLDMGILSTIQHYFFGLNLPIIIFALAIFLVSLNKLTKKKLILGITPLIILLLTNGLFFVCSRIRHGASFFVLNKTGFLINLHFFWKAAIFQYTFSIIWLLLVVIWVCKYLKTNNEKLVFISVLISGLTSRVMMDFSPTVYISATRTCTYLSFIFIIFAIYLFCKYCNLKQKWIIIEILSIFVILNAGITYVDFFRNKLLISLWGGWNYLQNP